MLHRLALAWGVPDVDALAERLTPAQLRRWMAYYAVEPFGGGADWQRAGTVAATVANFRAFRPANAPVVKASDFGPRPYQPPLTPRQKAERLAAGRAGWEALARSGRLVLVGRD